MTGPSVNQHPLLHPTKCPPAGCSRQPPSRSGGRYRGTRGPAGPAWPCSPSSSCGINGSTSADRSRSGLTSIASPTSMITFSAPWTVDLVRQILLEPLDHLQQPIHGRVRLEVVRRVIRQLLSQVHVGQLLPTPPTLGVVHSAFDHVGQDLDAQRLDPRHDRSGLAVRPAILVPAGTATDRSGGPDARPACRSGPDQNTRFPSNTAACGQPWRRGPAAADAAAAATISRCSMRVRTSSPCRSRSPPKRYFKATGWMTTLPPATRLARFLAAPRAIKAMSNSACKRSLFRDAAPSGNRTSGRSACLQDLDRRIDRLAVDAFAVHAECAHPRQEPKPSSDFGETGANWPSSAGTYRPPWPKTQGPAGRRCGSDWVPARCRARPPRKLSAVRRAGIHNRPPLPCCASAARTAGTFETARPKTCRGEAE